MPKMNIKSGVQVKVLSGADKGKTGKVIQVFPKLGRIVVEGVNVSKRHLKTRRQGEKGQIVEFFMPIDASNVVATDAVVDAEPKKKPAAKKRAAKKA